MKWFFLPLLCFALNCEGVHSAIEYDVKRGTNTFMAFVYCTDPSVVDASGERLVRSAVLIRKNWLVTTAIGPSLLDPNDFSKKTLLARAGAITIDSKLTLNEDEDEQEREVVQIVRPYKHSATQWWTTDISLMKTLIPFNMTLAVGIQILNFKQIDLIATKTCSILVYTKKYRNSTEDKILMMLYVDLLPPSISNCGSHFTADTMACAADSDENKDAVYDPEFCQGNSGGPLICNNDVIGLQTYIGNNCAQPHLYQLLSPWDNFITCGIEDKCQDKQCEFVCDVLYKDPPKITPPATPDTAQDIIAFLDVPSTSTIETTTTELILVTSTLATTITTNTNITTFSEIVTEAPANVNPTGLESRETETVTMDLNTEIKFMPVNFITEPTEQLTISDQTNLHPKPTQSAPWPKVTKLNNETRRIKEPAVMEMQAVKHWPKERLTDNKTKDDENVQRHTELEAQQAPEVVQTTPQWKDENKKTKGPIMKLIHHESRADPRTPLNYVLQTMLFAFLILLCL